MHNGFYEYTPEEARLWRETYEEFSYDIRRLALKISCRCRQKEIRIRKESLKSIIEKISFSFSFQ